MAFCAGARRCASPARLGCRKICPRTSSCQARAFRASSTALRRPTRARQLARRRSSPRSSPQDLAGRARCLVAHPVNPPHLVPVVELCGAPWTAQTRSSARERSMESLGQVPIVVLREIEGFILNRLQGALLTEALRLVGEGYCRRTTSTRPSRRPRPALVVHGTVRDDRTQCAGRRRRLLRALQRFLSPARSRPAPPAVWDRTRAPSAWHRRSARRRPPREREQRTDGATGACWRCGGTNSN